MKVNADHDAKVEAEIDRKGDLLRNLAKSQARQARPRRELTREELENMTAAERLANRGKVLAEDLGRTNNYDVAVEQSTQHGLISALEMLIGRKILLGSPLPVLDPEIVDDMQIETRPGERLRLYEPAFDIEALNVLPEQNALPETTQARMELEVDKLFQGIEAGTDNLKLTQGEEAASDRPALLIANAVVLDEAARNTIRQQVNMLATQLRAQGAGVDDVKAFSDELTKAWTEMVTDGLPLDEEVPAEACERALNALSSEQADRLCPALEAASNKRLGSYSVGRDQIMGALLDAGASHTALAQFNAALPQGGRFNLAAICDAIGAMPTDDGRDSIRRAFNTAMKNSHESRFDNLVRSGGNSADDQTNTQTSSQGLARRA